MKQKETHSKLKTWVEGNKIIGNDMFFNKTFITLKEIVRYNVIYLIIS